jgi:farnesyl-diphosphate farnesyltransferase
LARATDTIADTEIVPVAERLEMLDLLRGRILGTNAVPLDFGPLAGRQGSVAERLLLERIEEAVTVFSKFSYSDQQRVREVLQTITSGQELDLNRFSQAGERCVVALQTDAELDDYTYRVAGCVGEFWTRICRAHLLGIAGTDEAYLLGQGVRFGKGLQLVNILRDLPKDLHQGRCYLPANRLRSVGLNPGDLQNSENMGRLRPLYDEYLDLAQAHLAAGWEYANHFPVPCLRLRLACALPVLIGVRTIQGLRGGNVLDGRQRIKISRGEVRTLGLRLLVRYPWPGAWRKLFSDAAR